MNMHALGIAAAALLAAAQEGGGRKPPPANVGGLEGKGSATVTGIVKFKGKKRAPKPIREIAGNAFCSLHHKGKPPQTEEWVYGKNGDDDTVRNVLVYVSKGLEGKKFPPPAEPAVLDQVACLYTPHVVGVMAGQTLEIRNSDDTLHNVMTNPIDNKSFNEPMSGKGKLEKVFKTPEFKVNLRCVMHPWMSAYVHVMAHPFYAITQEDGSFTLKGLPPGEYEVSALHEVAASPDPVPVKVGADEVKKIEFTYPVK